MSFSGTRLKERNEQIVKCISDLKYQRNELNYLIDKQHEEKLKLENEVKRITYKLGLINKSVNQRIITRNDYDKTIKEAEENYEKIVESSGKLLDEVNKNVELLEESMDKKTGTDSWHWVDSTSDETWVREDGGEIGRSAEFTPSETRDGFPYFNSTKVL